MSQQKIYLANGQTVICDTTKTTSEGTYRTQFIYNVFCCGTEETIVNTLHSRENPYADYVMKWTFPSGVYFEFKLTYIEQYHNWSYSAQLTDGKGTTYPIYFGLKYIPDSKPDPYYVQAYMRVNTTTSKFAIDVNSFPCDGTRPELCVAQNMTSEKMSKYSNDGTTIPNTVYPALIVDYCNNDIAILGDVLAKPDPYNPGGSASPDGSGGGGDFDTSTDPIPFPDLPSLGASNTGFLSIYTPTPGEVNQLAAYMWTDDFITNVKKLYSDPADALISFGIVPYSIPSAVDTDIKVGGISTHLSMHKALSQYLEVDCGTLSLHEFFGSCFDYQPYTSLQIYCPFSGYHTIDADNCMNNTLSLKYQFDILSGSFVAHLMIGDAVMYQWGGTALMTLPISSYSMDALIKGAVTATASVAGAVATGGALAPIAGAMTVASVTSMKPEISHGGGVGSASALFSVRQPYVVIKRPRQVLPKSQNIFSGYPAEYTTTLDTLSGYTEIESIHLENMTCTDNEKSQIEELLQQGVIL